MDHCFIGGHSKAVHSEIARTMEKSPFHRPKLEALDL